MKIKVTSQADAAEAFEKYGTPIELNSSAGTYTPYQEDSANDVFDEAMNILRYSKSITLVFNK